MNNYKKVITIVNCAITFSLMTHASLDDNLLWSFSTENGISNGLFDSTKFRKELKVSSSEGPETLSYVSNQNITPFL